MNEKNKVRQKSVDRVVWKVKNYQDALILHFYISWFHTMLAKKIVWKVPKCMLFSSTTFLLPPAVGSYN